MKDHVMYVMSCLAILDLPYIAQRDLEQALKTGHGAPLQPLAKL